MKSTFKLASIALLMASSAAFAAPQTTAHPAAPAPAVSPAASHPAPAAPTSTDIKAAKKQISEHEKTALAACKSKHGAEKSTCKKEAMAAASNARAHLKAQKHS